MSKNEVDELAKLFNESTRFKGIAVMGIMVVSSFVFFWVMYYILSNVSTAVYNVMGVVT